MHVSLCLRQLFLKCYPLCPLNLPCSVGAEPLLSLRAICCHNNPSPTPEHSWTCLLQLTFLRGLCKVVSQKEKSSKASCPWDSEGHASCLPYLRSALRTTPLPPPLFLVLGCSVSTTTTTPAVVALCGDSGRADSSSLYCLLGETKVLRDRGISGHAKATKQPECKSELRS